MVLLTRTDPPLPLHRYRLDGAITELRAADLAFTTAEVAMLVQREGLDLEPSEMSLLQSRTGGGQPVCGLRRWVWRPGRTPTLALRVPR